MCGLVAVVDKSGQPVDPGWLQAMADVIRHRGPDDSGYWSRDGVGLAFRRLSIQDLSPCGHQPMSTGDERYTIVFNGEIYNFVELRAELQALGHQFVSHGDTEVLLKSYLQWGEACLQRLNGMWAFVIHDRHSGEVFGSRDRLGIKPLYRYQGERYLLLASEIKSILASGQFKPQANMGRVANFLLNGSLDQDCSTFFAGIEQVPPGYAFRIQGGQYQQWPYWQIDSARQLAMPDAPERFAALFEDSIALQLRSDVPVGVNLSGGLDSTSILCAAARRRVANGDQSPLLAFCYMSPEFDERQYIDATLAQTGARLVPLQTSPQRIWQDFEKLLGFHDEPFHSMTAVIGYQLMQLAADNGVKVLLNGQGADEVLGGYPSYFRDYWYTLARAGQFGKAWREIATYAGAQGQAARPLFGALLKHMLKSALMTLPAYRNAADQRWRDNLKSDNWFDPQLAEVCPLDRVASPPTLPNILKQSVTEEPLPIYLRVEDRNSMACSIEARVPFLDHRLVEFGFSLASDWKLHGPWNKFILREAMRGRIPELVRTRGDKMGFPTSVATWLKTDLYEPARDLLQSARTELPYVRIDRVLQHLEQLRQGKGGRSADIIRVLQVLLWQRKYLA